MARLRIVLTGTLFVVIFLGTFATGYCAGAETTDRAAFEELYGKLKAAMNSRNMNVVAAMLAPDFQSEDTSGKVQTSEQMLASLAAVPLDSNKKSQTAVISFNVNGNTAAVVQRYQMNTSKLAADGSAKLVALITVSDDVWSRTAGSWKLLRTVTRQMDYLVDGQVVLHKFHDRE